MDSRDKELGLRIRDRVLRRMKAKSIDMVGLTIKTGRPRGTLRGLLERGAACNVGIVSDVAKAIGMSVDELIKP